MKILITGCSGFIGRHLVHKIIETETLSSSTVLYGLVRKASTSLPNGVKPVTLDELQELHVDALINLAGEPIAGKRWSPARKQVLRDSRIQLTQSLYEKLTPSPNVVISMSAVGYYGYDEKLHFSEDTTPKHGFAHELCRDWENEANKFKESESRVCIFRLGVVLGNGGALKQMLLPYLLCMGGRIGSGLHGFPWIHIDDVCEAIIHAIEKPEYNGAINLVAPELTTQREFSDKFARSLRRPTFLPTPSLTLKLMFGEMSELLVEGQFVVPKKLQEIGYQFQYPHLQGALENCAERLLHKES